MVDFILSGAKIRSSRNSEKLCFDISSTRCEATVYIWLQYRYRERTEAAALRFRRFLVMDLALSGWIALGPMQELSWLFEQLDIARVLRKYDLLPSHASSVTENIFDSDTISIYLFLHDKVVWQEIRHKRFVLHFRVFIVIHEQGHGGSSQGL